jgi:hypothetical protein
MKDLEIELVFKYLVGCVGSVGVYVWMALSMMGAGGVGADGASYIVVDTASLDQIAEFTAPDRGSRAGR